MLTHEWKDSGVKPAIVCPDQVLVVPTILFCFIVNAQIFQFATESLIGVDMALHRIKAAPVQGEATHGFQTGG